MRQGGLRLASAAPEKKRKILIHRSSSPGSERASTMKLYITPSGA